MVPPTALTPPSAEDLAIWAQGARTMKQAMQEFGLTYDTLLALIKDGTLRFRIRDLMGTYLIARVDLVKYVASLPQAPLKQPTRGRQSRTPGV
jgi:hypothetical protein